MNTLRNRLSGVGRVWLVIGLLACDPDGAPSINPDDATARTEDAGPGTRQLAPQASVEATMNANGFVSPPPNASWTSPAECPLHTDDAHCEVCWSWEDIGPRSLGRWHAEDHFGRAVALADFNGDGYPDLAIGAPEEWNQGVYDSGLVYVFLGTERGFQPWRVFGDPVSPIHDSQFGSYLHAVDVDDDGRSELFVGYGRWITNTPIHMYAGATGLAHHATWTISDLDPGGSTDWSSNLGRAWASGDFDGDGDVDVAVGADNFGSGAGRVYVLENDGGALSFGYELVGTNHFGESLGADASGKLIVGERGAVRVFDDATPGSVYTSAHSMPSFGARLAVADLDGDGTDEILVGGFQNTFVEVAGTGHRIFSASTQPSAYFEPVGVGDFNDDGDTDVALVHIRYWSPSPGDTDAQILLGDGTLTPSSPFIIGSFAWAEVDDELGVAAAVGDVDGNGDDDLVLGADGLGALGSGGRVYVFADSAGWTASAASSQTIHQESPLDEVLCDVCTTYTGVDGVRCNDYDGLDICVGGACVTRECGDGYREPSTSGQPAEDCDDGNLDDTDTCNSLCEALPYTLPTGGRSYPFGPRYTAGVDGEGRALFTWAVETDGTWAIHALRVDALGVPQGAAFILADGFGVGVDARPSVAGLPAGGWVVAYSAPNGDGVEAGIHLQPVAVDGTLGAAQTANETVFLDQLSPSVAAFGDGVVVAWVDTSDSLDGAPRRVVARQFDATLAPVSDELLVSADADADHDAPVIAASGDHYFVAWVHRTGVPTDPTAVHGRRFDATGPIDAADLVLAPSRASEPAVATLASGDFVAVWRDGTVDARGDIHGRRVAVTGDPLTEAAESIGGANVADRQDSAPSVAALRGDDYLVLFQVGRSERGLGVGLSSSSTSVMDLPGFTTRVSELTAGDGSIVATPGGVWALYSTGTDPAGVDAVRATVAFHLSVDP